MRLVRVGHKERKKLKGFSAASQKNGMSLAEVLRITNYKLVPAIASDMFLLKSWRNLPELS